MYLLPNLLNLPASSLGSPTVPMQLPISTTAASAATALAGCIAAARLWRPLWAGGRGRRGGSCGSMGTGRDTNHGLTAAAIGTNRGKGIDLQRGSGGGGVELPRCGDPPA